MATVIVTNDELEKYFSGFSRVIRDADSRITRTIEAKDANEDELQICEVNPAFLCFDRRWLEENIQNLSTNNAQGELYLTDLIKKAFEMHGSIPALTIPVHEAYGANTPEQLARVEEVLKVA